MKFSIISAGLLVLVMWAGWAPCTQAKHHGKRQKHLRPSGGHRSRIAGTVQRTEPALEPRFAGTHVSRSLSNIVKTKVNAVIAAALPARVVDKALLKIEVKGAVIQEFKCEKGGFQDCISLRYNKGGKGKMKVEIKDVLVITEVSYGGSWYIGNDKPLIVLRGVSFALDLTVDPETLDVSVDGHTYSHSKAEVSTKKMLKGIHNGKIKGFLGENAPSKDLQDLIKGKFDTAKLVTAFVSKRSELLTTLLGIDGPVKQGEKLIDAVKAALAKKKFNVNFPVEVFKTTVFTVQHFNIAELKFSPKHISFEIKHGNIHFALNDVKANVVVTGTTGATTAIEQGSVTASVTAAIPKLDIKLKWVASPNIKLTYESSTVVTQVSKPKVEFESKGAMNQDRDKDLNDPIQKKINDKVKEAIEEHLTKINAALIKL